MSSLSYAAPRPVLDAGVPAAVCAQAIVRSASGGPGRP